MEKCSTLRTWFSSIRRYSKPLRKRKLWRKAASPCAGSTEKCYEVKRLLLKPMMKRDEYLLEEPRGYWHRFSNMRSTILTASYLQTRQITCEISHQRRSEVQNLFSLALLLFLNM